MRVLQARTTKNLSGRKATTKKMTINITRKVLLVFLSRQLRSLFVFSTKLEAISRKYMTQRILSLKKAYS
jgi:hypothetical protein